MIMVMGVGILSSTDESAASIITKNTCNFSGAFVNYNCSNCPCLNKTNVIIPHIDFPYSNYTPTFNYIPYLNFTTPTINFSYVMPKLPNYYFDTTPPTASANLKSGFYNTNKVIKLTMSEDGNIYYTLNGKTPTTQSKQYFKPIIIKATTTIKYLAVDMSGNPSPIYTNKYKIDKTKPKVLSSTPNNHAISVSLTTPVTIKFNENIYKSTHYGEIGIKNKNTNKMVSVNKSIKGNKLTLKMIKSRFSFSTYQICIPSGAIKDKAGNNNNRYSSNFQTC